MRVPNSLGAITRKGKGGFLNVLIVFLLFLSGATFFPLSRLSMARWPIRIIVRFGSIQMELGLGEEELDCFVLRLCGQRMWSALTLLRLFGRQGINLGQLGIL